MKFTYAWAMPSADTFSIEPIGELVRRYLRASQVSIDPFARNFRWPTYTNDLNPASAAQWHLDALDFLLGLRDQFVQADLLIFDPPYSPRQMKEVYEGIGLEMGPDGALRTASWAREREVAHDLLVVGAHVISCGWNTTGMGKGRGYEKIELLVVNHGSGHNDTLVLVERKVAHQLSLAEA